jgi:hypothetical protein
VAITVAQRAAGINCLGATFFFSRDQDDRKKSLGFVHTIAYQLAHYDQTYGKAIADAIDNNLNALDKVLAQQFNLLVAQPLRPFLEKRATPLVLVFDALDECVEPDASKILSLIISSVCQLPNIKVFLTTRPELGLRKTYMDTPVANIFHFQEIEDLIVEKDISLYMDYHLSPLKLKEALGSELYNPCWQPTAKDKAQLVKLSGKLFIFASTAIKFILDKHHNNPEGRLAKLLKMQSSGGFLPPLGVLYLHVLNSAKPDDDAEDWLNNFKMIVGAILVLHTPLPALNLAHLLGQPESTIKSTLANLHSILAPMSDSSAFTYKVHHKSFPDYITGHSCPSEYQIIEKDHHLKLFKCCLEVMNKQLRFNVCQVSLRDKYQNLDTLLKKGLNVNCLSKELQYAACYWTNHFSKLQDIDPELAELLETFSKEHLMHWIEVLAYINQLDTAYTALKKAADTLVC